ncbi:hypothetical protein TNCV_556831 [Trichonephila clavipes]|uniref:Uncharacterized protein n=1 Tax=Trichonephila clavipes TaxID=2585209 RepID=A0A8X6RLN4_TRICX|nr:hypothetical protein TNCV_556831 [Trichonephila clavipes]
MRSLLDEVETDQPEPDEKIYLLLLLLHAPIGQQGWTRSMTSYTFKKSNTIKGSSTKSCLDENIDTTGALGGNTSGLVLMFSSKENLQKGEGADGSGNSQAPALAKVSTISLPSRSI